MTLFNAQRLPTEKEFSRILVEGLEKLHYMVNHVYPLQTKTGWRTSTTLKGLPDLMAVGRGVTIWIEVKGQQTPTSAEQLHVLEHFAGVESNRCWLLRPSDDRQTIVNWMAWPDMAPRRFGWDEGTLARAAITKHQRTTRR